MKEITWTCLKNVTMDFGQYVKLKEKKQESQIEDKYVEKSLQMIFRAENDRQHFRGNL